VTRNQRTALQIFLLVSLTFAALVAYSQVSGGTLTGTVMDKGGATIPNARISIQNVSTEVTRVVTTNSDGLYTAPNLLPGTYEATVSAVSFATLVQKGITLTVGAQQILNVTLQVGSVSEKIQVTAQAPAVQLNDSVISGVVDTEQVVGLPLNGRDWTLLATLEPGVDSLNSLQASAGTTHRAFRGFGTELTISGSRPQENNYRIDGISVNDYSNGGPGSVEGSTLGADAVQEFSVMTSNYSTEYGRTSGGVINATTKPGTDSFHGDAYEFLRNSALDARNYFDPPNIPAFRRNQFGGSIGGPIRKNHTFFFVDYEGLREFNDVSVVNTTISQAARNGTLCSIPQAGVCSTHQVTGAFNPDPVTGIDKTILPYLALWALPNAGLVGNGDAGIYQFGAPVINSENFATVRIDHKFSENDSMFGSFQYDRATSSQPDPNNDVLLGNKTGRTYVALEETHIFNPQLINSARFGFNRSVANNTGLSAINPAANNPALNSGYAGSDNPQIDVPGFASAQPGLNQFGQPAFNAVQNSFQGYDDVFLTKGIHSLKFGFSVERLQYNIIMNAPAGDYGFGSLNDLLINQPNNLGQALPCCVYTNQGFRSSIFAGYVQDDIHLRSNLTVNVGVRYEMSTVPTEVRGLLIGVASPFNQSFQTAHVGNGIFQNPTLKNFEPRVGFAWDPFRDGKTSIRAGLGMYDVLPLPYYLGQVETSAYPFSASGTVNNLALGSFPNQAYSLLASQVANALGVRIPYIEPHPKRDYVMQWNFSLQRQLTSNLTGTLAYVGSHGVHEPFRADDMNVVLPLQSAAAPFVWPAPGNGTCPANPAYCPVSPLLGRMDALAWVNSSSFHALEAHIEERMSHGFSVGGSYTWERAIDQGSGTGYSDQYNNAISNPFYFLPTTRRGPADYNIPQNLTINYIWQIPGPSASGPAAWVARGWQLAGIYQIRSGLPFTPLIGGNPTGAYGSHSYAYPDRVFGPGCSSLVNSASVQNYIKLDCFTLPAATPAIASECIPFAPNGVPAPGTCENKLGNASRNLISGPRLNNFDFSVIKDTRIMERLAVQFRAEFFNLFNHSNFLPPLSNSQLYAQDGSVTGNAGAINQTATSNREIQFALKFTF
jgi:Carboxypeptidase regulatory-like domain/TonB dependent receptor/TonB-dependent Receptor Plug Domain